MARILGYVGMSVDGYIASPDGTLDWLRKYDTIDFGPFAFETFLEGIRTIVMGRATYDVVADHPGPWAYAGKRVFVVTSRPIDRPIGDVELWTGGIDALVGHLRALDDGDVWMVGGGLLQQAFIACGALDQLELYVVPEIVGAGIPLFPANGFSRSIKLVSTDVLPEGCVRLFYEFGATA
ncbi:dihydrofolate reductase family protein [Phreatobacter stygius]|uniref:Dihydrofolate reductase n=1 Tax=Phreatobacter stygius TaxID=1940610 RepID=A0A4D7B3T9_9HYPH|nr:dihydrofolate reductase family protein [Phreatobacter stygius]QCI65208.1 dihydrofolate reductase [Phreatobacter stygius]